MYLTEIESSDIRSIFTKLRIDMNCSWDCKNRSFWYKNVTSNICTSCNQVENVEHVLLHCNHPVLSDNRETFHKKYCQYVKHFSIKNSHDQIAEILNLNPSCSQELKYKAVECICSFIKKAYFILNTKLNKKPGLEMPKNTEWQKQISTKLARHISITAVISSIVNNQVILQNIHLRTENTSGLCGVFDKTEAQWWNETHVHNCYFTMRSKINK